MKMAEYIGVILKSRPVTLMSWGAKDFGPLPGNKGLSFYVNGIQYRGIVNIEYDRGPDAFTVITDKERRDYVYLDSLVEVIDGMVEKGNLSDNEYEKQVTKWLNRTVLE